MIGRVISLGTGFLINWRARTSVINYTPINERLCCIRIRGKFRNYSINEHAPTEEKPEEEKDDFYEELERAYDRCPKYDIKLVLGDMNTKVGKENIYIEG